jgi:alcohol dehydrogenase class IV
MKYHLPTQVIFGSGAIGELRQIVGERLRAARPFLVTDKGIDAAGILNKVREPLIGVPVFDEIEPNPKNITVDRGGEMARVLKPDLVIGLGGGSVLDAAKAIAAAVGLESANKDDGARALIQEIKDLSLSLSIPSFRDLGISESDFPAIAQKSFQNNSNPSNPREAGVKDYLDILRRVSLPNS